MTSATQSFFNGRHRYQTGEGADALEFHGFESHLTIRIGLAFKFRAPPRPPGTPGNFKQDTSEDYVEPPALTPPDFPVPYVNGIKVEMALDTLYEQTHPPPLHRWTNFACQRYGQYYLPPYNC